MESLVGQQPSRNISASFVTYPYKLFPFSSWPSCRSSRSIELGSFDDRVDQDDNVRAATQTAPPRAGPWNPLWRSKHGFYKTRVARDSLLPPANAAITPPTRLSTTTSTGRHPFGHSDAGSPTNGAYTSNNDGKGINGGASSPLAETNTTVDSGDAYTPSSGTYEPTTFSHDDEDGWDLNFGDYVTSIVGSPSEPSPITERCVAEAAETARQHNEMFDAFDFVPDSDNSDDAGWLQASTTTTTSSDGSGSGSHGRASSPLVRAAPTIDNGNKAVAANPSPPHTNDLAARQMAFLARTEEADRLAEQLKRAAALQAAMQAAMQAAQQAYQTRQAQQDRERHRWMTVPENELKIAIERERSGSPRKTYLQNLLEQRLSEGKRRGQ
ncbi:MAG: hypothetical protein Q9213_002920 [Squamulea squamosa]